MKWLGSGEGDEGIKFEMERGPQRTQDDASVGYVFQRPPDPEFTTFAPKQLRWANMAGDDSIIDNPDKWKYPVNSKVSTPNNVAPFMGTSGMSAGLYDFEQNKNIPPEHLVYMSNMSNISNVNQMQSGMSIHPPQYLPQNLAQQLPFRQLPQQLVR
ncbi:hypothetical protein WA026_003205 [Henosepilachna vigintioctopunctata]|uniref:Uncharacterized protein n=1 Tax=Henosepilachna vigintioctopunctata TaxID=420089 RepID=A0AAW1TMP5_9CUCU